MHPLDHLDCRQAMQIRIGSVGTGERMDMSWLSSALEFLGRGWVGTLVGIAGVVAAIIIFFRTRRRTRFSYFQVGDRLLGLAGAGLPEGITAQYRGEPISNLTRSLIVLWNDGENTIAGTDVVEGDALRLRLKKEGNILTATVLKQTREVCQLVTQINDLRTEVRLPFSFLDARDGASVEVLHTSTCRHLDVLGTIRGLPEGLLDRGSTVPHTIANVSLESVRIFNRRSTHLLAMVCGVLAFVFGIYQYRRGHAPDHIATAWALMISGFLYAGLALLMIFASRRPYPKSLHTQELG